MNAKIPANWGQDYISYFIKSAYENAIVTFSHFSGTPIVEAIYNIDELFKLLAKVNYGQDELLPFFVGRCHCIYLTTIQLSTSGQVVEAYMVMRGCLENALYALLINDDSEAQEKALTWINREKDKQSKKQCRNLFSFRNVIRNLSNHDEKLKEKIQTLYNHTIDYGAHPNFQGLATTSSISEERISVQCLCPGSNAFMLCAQKSVEVGIGSFEVFNLTLSDKKLSNGFNERLEKLKKFIQKI